MASNGDADQHRQAELAALELVARLERNRHALPAHTPELEVLVILEGEEDELPSAAPDTYTNVIDA